MLFLVNAVRGLDGMVYRTPVFNIVTHGLRAPDLDIDSGKLWVSIFIFVRVRLPITNTVPDNDE